MQIKYFRLSKDSFPHSIRMALLGALAWLLLTLLPARVANAQGTIILNNRIPGSPGPGQTSHIWGPSSTNPMLRMIGVGSNDSPSGTTPFGEDLTPLIGAGGSGGQYGYATTYAQLVGAAGLNAPYENFVPVGQTTTFRSGSYLGCVAGIVDTLDGIPAGSAATLAIVAWDNSSGLYPTWSQAETAWMAGLLAAGRSVPFTATLNGGYLNNQAGTETPSISGLSFNLYLAGFPIVTVASPASAGSTTGYYPYDFFTG